MTQNEAPTARSRRALDRRGFLQVGAGALSLGLLGQFARSADALAAAPVPATPRDPGNPNRSTPVVAKPSTRLRRVPQSRTRPSGIEPPTTSIDRWKLQWVDDFIDHDLRYPRWAPYRSHERAGLRWDPSHVVMEDSQVVLQTYRDPAFDDEWVSAGMSNAAMLTQTHGKYEVCYRIDKGVGVSHCLLLWPEWPASGPPEIDFAEDDGHSREWLQGTLHWRTEDGTPATEPTVLAVDTTEWHVLGVEWGPHAIDFTVDGAVWRTLRGAHVPSSPLGLCLQTQTWGRGSAWEAPDPEDGTRVNMHVDWVAVYSRHPGT